MTLATRLGGAALLPIGLKLRAELHGTNRYVAWRTARRARLFRLCPEPGRDP
jgi:hypothetical protein